VGCVGCCVGVGRVGWLFFDGGLGLGGSVFGVGLFWFVGVLVWGWGGGFGGFWRAARAEPFFPFLF